MELPGVAGAPFLPRVRVTGVPEGGALPPRARASQASRTSEHWRSCQFDLLPMSRCGTSIAKSH